MQSLKAGSFEYVYYSRFILGWLSNGVQRMNMQTIYTYAIITPGGCECVRANRHQAIECLRHYRGLGYSCKLVLEVTPPRGDSTEVDIIGYGEPIPECRE